MLRTIAELAVRLVRMSRSPDPGPVMAVVMDRAFNQRLSEMFDDDLSHCKLVPLDRRAPPWQQLFEAVARLASPLL